MNPWIRLRSGRKFHFLRPRQDEIDIEDIAHNLSRICRFTGAIRRFYSVAEHCVNCASFAPEGLELEALLHDAQEFAVGDCASPLKSILPQYQEIEHRAEKAIARKFDLQFPFPAVIKEIDLRMLVTEMKVLLPGDDWKNLPFAPFDIKLRCWDSEIARKEFLKAFRRHRR